MIGPWPAATASVVDGDTLVLDVDLDWTVTVTARCRLKGIDTPPLSTPEGKAAAKYLAQIAVGPLTVTHYGRERYGRWLVHISSADHLSFADALVDAGHARRWT